MFGGTWLARLIKHVTLDLEVRSLSPMLGVDTTYKKKEIMLQNCYKSSKLQEGNQFFCFRNPVYSERLKVEITDSDAYSGPWGNTWKDQDGNCGKSRAHSPPYLNRTTPTQLHLFVAVREGGARASVFSEYVILFGN